LLFVGIGNAKKIVTLPPGLVQNGHLIHRKIVFDHILYNTLSRVRLVKHSAY